MDTKEAKDSVTITLLVHETRTQAGQKLQFD
jgi:hypothetical protein